MTYTVNMQLQPPVTFAPANIAEEVGQNIRTLLATPMGSVPFARALGLDPDVMDEPLPILRARMAGVITSLLAEYEPRAVVTRVDFVQNDDSGRLIPIVYYDLAEEVNNFG